MTSTPSTRTVLLTLSKARLLELARAFAVSIPPAAPREEQVGVLVDAPQVRFRDLLGILGRDELKAACRTHGLDDAGRARPLLAARLMQAHGAVESAPPKPIFRAHQIPRYAPMLETRLRGREIASREQLAAVFEELERELARSWIAAPGCGCARWD
ncbi:MAG TPA: hypothetical protein VF316_05185 [Polyangiaceae bacterium]